MLIVNCYSFKFRNCTARNKISLPFFKLIISLDVRNLVQPLYLVVLATTIRQTATSRLVDVLVDVEDKLREVKQKDVTRVTIALN